MSDTLKNTLLFSVLALLYVITGFTQSWNTAMFLLNFGIISAIMALGVNLQWGIAGLFNVGIMGFVAVGGLTTVLVSMPPVQQAWTDSAANVLGVVIPGGRIIGALLLGLTIIYAMILTMKKMPKGKARLGVLVAVAVVGFFAYRAVFDPAVAAIEAVEPATYGNLGGLGLPILVAWPLAGLLAAAVAWVVGKTALGLRSDYLAIATLGIAEIVIAVMKNEDWLARGVKNVVSIPRPLVVPYEVDLQKSPEFIDWMNRFGLDPVTTSSIMVKLIYFVLFAVVLAILMWMSHAAIHSPWGRMMRAVRDNEVAAEAMGVNVTRRHLQVFVIGSAICGIAGAMMTTLDSQLTPGSYNPLRYTFLIWVMVIVGGSGNNLGAVLGGFLIWFFWVQVEPIGQWIMGNVTSLMSDGPLKEHLLDSVAHMRLLTMGVILLLVLRFSPQGLIPEK